MGIWEHKRDLVNTSRRWVFSRFLLYPQITGVGCEQWMAAKPDTNKILNTWCEIYVAASDAASFPNAASCEKKRV